MRMVKVGYVAKAFAAFIDENTVSNDSLNGTSKPRLTLNGVLLSADDGRRVKRWRREQPYIDLGAADTFLTKHEMHLWEFENWCEETYGTVPFFDITIETLLSSDGQPNPAA